MFQNKFTSDSRLVLSVLRGKREDFGVLVRRYLPAVHAVAYARLGNASDADDVAQDAFVRAFQRLDTLRERHKFGPWLMTIARNATMQVLRSRAREAEIVAEVPPPPPSIDPDVEQRELRESLHRAIMQLDPEQRELLLLRYFSGLSIREMATLLDITPNAAKKRVQRAREILGEQMFDRIEKPAETRERDEQVKRIMGAILALPLPAKAVAAAGATALAVKLLAGCATALIVVGGALYLANTGEEEIPTVTAVNRPLDAGANSLADSRETLSVDREAPLRGTRAVAQAESNAAAKSTVGSIAGRVYDSATNEAVAGLELSLYPVELDNGAQRRLRPVVTTDDGAYQVKDLPTGTYRFENPTLSGFPYGELDERVAVHAGKTATYDLTLDTGVSITGVVTDADGAPLVGVNVAGVTNQENRWRNTESGDDGSFRIVGFGSGGTGFELMAFKDGYAMPTVQAPTVPESGLHGVNLVMLEEATVSGKVVDPSGKPMQSVWVTAWPLSGGDGPIGKTETRQDGSFTIHGLFPGEHRIVFGSPGGSSWTIRNEAARVALTAAERRTGLVLVKESEGEYAISGRVVDSEGKPVRANLSILQPVSRSTYSDDDGAFRFEELPEGFYIIDAEDYNTSMRRSKMVGVDVPGATDLEIVLDTPVKLCGVVVDKSTGEPITQFDLSVESGLIDQISGSGTWEYKPHGDIAGRFELDGVGPGDITLFARADGHAQAIHHVPALKAGETREGIQIELSRGVAVNGRVINTLRQPVSDALVYLGPIPEQQMRTHAAMDKTDAEGRFTVHVAPGDTQTLSAYHTSYAPAQTDARLAGEQVDGVEIVLPVGGTVDGVIARGELPLTGLPVSLRCGEIHMGTAETDERGVFRFEHVSAGDGSVTAYLQEGASAVGYIKRQFIMADNQAVHVDLGVNAGMGTLSGQVIQQGQAVAGMRLEISAL
ncbi:MAG: sigma-70 family RNA polymerase sigma factor, partial [Candidatus Hydrogenedentes bacterium]|nr:sigma-70 family RNA polymerase sigma factor [Candidatus Hydrogenedentota bacterium]